MAAKGRDAAGNATTSAAVTVTVNNGSVPSLAAGYAFDEAAGTSAADASGHGLTGTLTNGAAWAPGKFGTALNLDGGNDYVNLRNAAGLQMTGSMTICGLDLLDRLPGRRRRDRLQARRHPAGYQLDTTVDTGPAPSASS